MFYKVLDNDRKLINITDAALFYSEVSDKHLLIPTSINLADAVKISNKLYYLQKPQASEDNRYIIESITADEYLLLKQQIEVNPSNTITTYLRELQDQKISEMCAACNKAITDGCSIMLSVGTKAFKFTIEDQLNINRLLNTALMDKSKYIIYHASGEPAKEYSISDFKLLYKQMNNHILYHTTYFNLLKQHIYELTTSAAIKQITYGIKLPRAADNLLLNKIRRT